MAVTLDFLLDPESDARIRELWRRLDDARLPSASARAPGGRPHVRFAAAAEIPVAARRDLRLELSTLALPAFWLTTLSTLTTSAQALVLGAVVDTELLAVHSAVHDVLAGRARGQSAYHLPGSWLPHCPLTDSGEATMVSSAFTVLNPVSALHARVGAVVVTDSRTATSEVLRTLDQPRGG